MKVCVYILAILSAGLLAGCGRSDTASNNSTRNDDGVITHGPAPALPQPASTADTQPTVSMLIIDNQQIVFGPARLRLNKADDKVVARVYSDEPTGNISGEETANSFDFEMPLKVDDPSKLSGASWTCATGSLEKQDSPFGIFLPSQQKILQPMNVTASFMGDATRAITHVKISGTFCMFSTTDQTPGMGGTIVHVIGVLDATSVTK